MRRVMAKFEIEGRAVRRGHEPAAVVPGHEIGREGEDVVQPHISPAEAIQTAARRPAVSATGEITAVVASMAEVRRPRPTI